MVIEVVERRRRALTAEQWQALNDSDGFWVLADSGYVSTRRAGLGRHEIVGHRHVGRALVDGVQVRVVEKAPGTVRALVHAATGAELRVEGTESPATDFDVISRLLLREFINAAGSYIGGRRQPRYEYRAASSPRLGGRLDMARTIRLHASGRPELFAYEEGRVIRDEPLDRLVLAGLSEVERAAPLLGLTADLVYDARWLAAALDEVRDPAYLATPRGAFLTMADDVQAAATPEDADLARLAAVALLHQGFEPEGAKGAEAVPRAWFIDLEALFEQAVRQTLGDILTDDHVDRGEPFNRWMFTGGADTSRTHPDFVVHRRGRPRASGDVKYKSLRVALGEQADEEDADAQARRRKEGRPDLYQVLVHAASLNVARAFIVYVSDDTFECRYLGRSATGCQTWTAQVRPARLREDLTAVADAVGLL